jgi:Phosphatidylethanolamine-binding protein
VTTCPPALQWTGVPADTKQLVLIMDDLVARKQMNSKQEAGWLWLPLIIGLIIGVTVAAMTINGAGRPSECSAGRRSAG